MDLTLAFEHEIEHLAHAEGPDKPAAHLGALLGHTDGVWGVCAVRVGQRELLASAGGDDRTVRVWDPSTGQPLFLTPIPSPALAVAQFGISSLIVGLATGVLAVSIGQRERPR